MTTVAHVQIGQFTTHSKFNRGKKWPAQYLNRIQLYSLHPNNKIPALIDPNGPGGKLLGLFESGAILLYLAEKIGQLLPADPTARFTRPSSG